MRIHIEAASFYGKRTGVGRYGLSISEALFKLRPKDQFTLFNFKRLGRKLEPDFALPPNTHTQFIRWFPGRAFSLLMRSGVSLPFELFGGWRTNLAVFPNFISWASLLHKKRLCVVHDLAFARFPEYTQTKNLRYLRRQLPKSLKRSTAIIAVSEFTKQDIIKTYQTPADKIHVIPNAIDHSIFNQAAAQRLPAVRSQYKLPEHYLLFVGTIEPRKNLTGLLDAYAQSYPQHQLPLIVIGGKGWNDNAIEQKFSELESLPIQQLGFVPDQDMAAIYASATAFVFPSLFEGFGIPPLEAMASGCPVICSNTTSLPEVVGDAALLVEPTDTADLAATITKLTQDETLRADLSKRGLAQSQKFTWDNSARQLSALIDQFI